MSTLSVKKSWFTLILFAIGVCLIALQFLSNLGKYLGSLFVPVYHPMQMEYKSYNQLLKAYVRGPFVNYKQLKGSALLNQAMLEFEQTSPDRLANPKDELCFWINAYNLLVIKNIADRYPIKSVHQIAQDRSLRKFLIGGKPYSVADIEMVKITPGLQSIEPKAVFLLCGGAQGYPALVDQAITAQNLESEINQAIVQFVNNPQNVFIDLDTDTVIISPFFKWRESLITKQFPTAFAFVNYYLNPTHQFNLEDKLVSKQFDVRFNWWLNDVALADNVRLNPIPQEEIEPVDKVPTLLPEQLELK